jgi:hypothetical protein
MEFLLIEQEITEKTEEEHFSVFSVISCSGVIGKYISS